MMSRETVLRQYLDEVKKDYDYVLLDCRPSLGMLVINALSASDYVLIPVQADYLAAEDMTELIGTAQSIRRQINPKLKIGGVFLTMANDTNFRKEIVESVKENYGKNLPVMDTVIPATVRQKPDGGYEMIAGHRRKAASELAQKETIPCLVRDLTDDEAIIIMVDSNLQRETLLPSEKAFAYKMKLDAMKRQGQRTDLHETSRPVGTKLRETRSDEQLADTRLTWAHIHGEKAVFSLIYFSDRRRANSL